MWVCVKEHWVYFSLGLTLSMGSVFLFFLMEMVMQSQVKPLTTKMVWGVFVCRYAASVKDGSQYFVLLIITDGVISDMAQTKESIVNVRVFTVTVKHLTAHDATDLEPSGSQVLFAFIARRGFAFASPGLLFCTSSKVLFIFQTVIIPAKT